MRHNSVSSPNSGLVSGPGQTNVYASMDEASFQQTGTIGSTARQLRDPRKPQDHRKYDKEKPKPFLDFNDFLAYMLEDL